MSSLLPKSFVAFLLPSALACSSPAQDRPDSSWSVAAAQTLMRIGHGGLMDPDFVKPVAIHLDRDPAVLTLDLTGGRPSVAVMIGGKGPFSFIVDTGAGASLIDSTLATQLGLSVTGHAHVHSPGGAGPQDLGIVVVPRIDLAGASLSAVSLIMADLRGRFGQNFVGVLSYRTLGNVLVTLDYSRKELRLASGKLEKGLPFTIPFQIGPGPIIVASTVEGQELELNLDSGQAGSFTLPKDLMSKLRLVAPVQADAPIKTLTGIRPSWNARLNGSIRLAGTEYRNPEVRFVEGEIGNMGGAIIQDLALTIDYNDRLVELRPSVSRRSP
jgi:Aspartyl protease